VPLGEREEFSYVFPPELGPSGSGSSGTTVRARRLQGSSQDGRLRKILAPK
jgi:hypothetical protein